MGASAPPHRLQRSTFLLTNDLVGLSLAHYWKITWHAPLFSRGSRLWRTFGPSCRWIASPPPKKKKPAYGHDLKRHCIGIIVTWMHIWHSYMNHMPKFLSQSKVDISIACCVGVLLNGNDVIRFNLYAVWNPRILPRNRWNLVSLIL